MPRLRRDRASPSTTSRRDRARSRCALAQQHVVEFNGNAYFDEGTFQSQNPYVWSTTQDCTTVSSLTWPRSMGTLLAGKKAIYAGDPTLASQDPQVRHLRPEPAALHRVHEAEHPTLLKTKYHVPAKQIAYVLLLQPRHLDLPAVGPAGDRAVQGGRCHHRRPGLRPVLGRHPHQGRGGAELPPRVVPRSAPRSTDQDQYVQPRTTPPRSQGHLFGMSELSPSTEHLRPDLARRQAVPEADRPPDPARDRR